MADRKTRLEKAQAEIRKLKRENDNLRTTNQILSVEFVAKSKCEEKRMDSSQIKKSIFLYMYDIAISAVILVFVYWIAINGYETFDVPYNFFLILVILISVKCLIDNREFLIKLIFRIILNDLIKPAISMLAGLFLCMFCLGEAWKGAKGYALDVGYTVILVVATTIVVMVIVMVSYLVIGIKSLFSKRK